MESKFIEFIGNPGSGKSTISQLLADHLIDNNKSIYDLSREVSNNSNLKKKIKKVLYILRFVFLRPITSYIIVKDIKKTNQPTTKLIVKMSANILYIKSLIDRLSRSNYDYVILDQGLIQAIWSINLEGKNSLYFPELMKDLPNSYCLIHVEVNDDLLIKRLNSREGQHSRFEKNMNNIDFKRSNIILEKLYELFKYSKMKFENTDKIELKTILDIVTKD